MTKSCTDDSGLFTCLIENIVGSCKSSANLDVLESPEAAGAGKEMMQASVTSKRTLKEMNVNQVGQRSWIQRHIGTQAGSKVFDRGGAQPPKRGGAMGVSHGRAP